MSGRVSVYVRGYQSTTRGFIGFPGFRPGCNRAQTTCITHYSRHTKMASQLRNSRSLALRQTAASHRPCPRLELSDRHNKCSEIITLHNKNIKIFLILCYEIIHIIDNQTITNRSALSTKVINNVHNVRQYPGILTTFMS